MDRSGQESHWFGQSQVADEEHRNEVDQIHVKKGHLRLIATRREVVIIVLIVAFRHGWFVSRDRYKKTAEW